MSRSIINCFNNGQYQDAHSKILGLKSDLVDICLEIKNEKNTVTKI